jgi:hypothetical protein
LFRLTHYRLPRCADVSIHEDTQATVQAGDTGDMLNDTSPAAQEVYFRRLAEMTPSERLSAGAALWQAGEAMERASVRRDYPDADEAEVTFRVAVKRFGAELAYRVYGRASDEL